MGVQSIASLSLLVVTHYRAVNAGKTYECSEKSEDTWESVAVALHASSRISVLELMKSHQSKGSAAALNVFSRLEYEFVRI